jgi:hypothetical protein
MDALAEEFQGQAEFLFVYGAEAHPDVIDVPGGYAGDRVPFSEEAPPAKRREAAQIFRRTLGVRRRMVVDDTDGTALRERYLPGKHLYNPVVVVGPDGRIIYAARWLRAERLGAFLRSYVKNGGRCKPVADEGPP